MDLLVRLSLGLRKTARRSVGLVVVVGLGAFIVFDGATQPFGPTLGVACAIWLLFVASRVKLKLSTTGEAPMLTDVELGLLLALALEAALVRFEGTLSGPFSPAVYVLVALVAAFSRPIAGAVVVAGVVLLEAVIRRFTFHETSLTSLAPHAVFVAAFAVLNLSFLRAEVMRTRATARKQVEGRLKQLKEDARSYRLLGAGGTAATDEGSEDRLARASVEEIHESVHYALDLLRRTLDLHTAVLLWLNDAGTHFRISELATESDEIVDVPIAVGDGVLGAVASRRDKLSLANLKPSYNVPYYSGPCPVRALSALPVLEGDTLRGVLVIDRHENVAFTAQEEELAGQAVRYCLRAIQNERVFVQLERAKVEQGKLYRAAQALQAALSEKDVLDVGVKAAREIASFDLAAVTVFDEATSSHEVCAAVSEDGEIDGLVGARFQHNAGLVSMVVQNRFPLPYKGDYDPAHQVVLSKRHGWPKLPSLLVLPLLLHSRPLGTLILGSRRRHAFGDSVRATLEVLASHLAVSLANARMVHKLEQMATTDGMTGLLNKRAMLESAEQKVQAAARFGRKLSVLITDIDFFKKVNDTYGHDVGDQVIRGLGEVLKRQKRTTDVVARFGGEEFVILCEETSEQGAMLLAERIREELERTVFPTPNGGLSVTCSVGVATFPEGGSDWSSLFKAADEALYVSKRSGRNRSTAWHARAEIRPSGVQGLKASRPKKEVG
ncbi:MAG: diguanylate cyclase [Myxococcales bacterium]|nr:diguanylate cyclase [Myxococcales bacterium]